MANWIRIDDDLLDHRKTILLSRSLGISEVATAGHLLGIWFFALRNAWRDGDLNLWGSGGIERAARWPGQEGALVKAMQDAGYLDDYKIHNWRQYTAKYVQRRIQRERHVGVKAATRRRQDGVKAATKERQP